MTPANPHHGYLTEPRWFTARNNHVEVARAAWDEQFRESDDERAERWRATKARRKAEGKCWQCAKPVAECKCPNIARAVVRELTCLETWAQVFSVGAFVFVVVIIFG